MKKNKEKLSKNCIYLWAEINIEQKYQIISTNEDYLTSSNINQKFDILEVKSLLDDKFYLTKKIRKGGSGKVYLGFPKEYLNEKMENIKYYSLKIMNTEKIDLDVFKNENNLLEKKTINIFLKYLHTDIFLKFH